MESINVGYSTTEGVWLLVVFMFFFFLRELLAFIILHKQKTLQSAQSGWVIVLVFSCNLTLRILLQADMILKLYSNVENLEVLI